MIYPKSSKYLDVLFARV